MRFAPSTLYLFVHSQTVTLSHRYASRNFYRPVRAHYSILGGLLGGENRMGNTIGPDIDTQIETAFTRLSYA